MTEDRPNIDVEGGDFLKQLGDDASKWAAAFCDIAKRKGLEIDEGWMIGWFANAIEHSGDVRRQRAKAVTAPDAAGERGEMTDDEPHRNAHSPQLDEPLRSAERAALDIAVVELMANVRALNRMHLHNHAKLIQHTLDRIAALVPDAVK